VTLLLLDVLVERRQQPGVARQRLDARAAGLQQRHRVAHMVVGLGEEGTVAGQRDLAAQAALDDGGGDQRGAVGGGVVDKAVEEAHAMSGLRR